jgi:predicted GNAT family N-acyltransferase
MPSNYYLIQVTWNTHSHQLMVLREQVFIEEQQVPIHLEWDNQDANAQHLLVLSNSGQPIACARLLKDGSIGRMAVLKEWRKLGLGAALLNKAVAIHRQQGIKIITLSAQVHAILFYEKAGFQVVSERYLEAGIWHVDMHLMPSQSRRGLFTD